MVRTEAEGMSGGLRGLSIGIHTLRPPGSSSREKMVLESLGSMDDDPPWPGIYVYDRMKVEKGSQLASGVAETGDNAQKEGGGHGPGHEVAEMTCE